MAEEKFSLFEIIIIACFISLIFSPVGIVLMWLKTKWSKKIKFIITGGFALVVAAVVIVFVLLNSSSEAGGGSGLPFVGIEQQADGGGGGGNKSSSSKPSSKSRSASKTGSSQSASQTESSTFVQKVTKSRWFYFLLLVLIMGVIVLIRNLKGFKPKNSANPYVDTKLYTIPIPDGFVFPEVKFSKLTLQPDEKICFATPAELKDNTGDIVITNKRFVFLGRKENYDFKINDLTSIFSLSNTTLSLAVGEQTYYFFIPDTQMRFVLQITKYIYGGAQ